MDHNKPLDPSRRTLLQAAAALTVGSVVACAAVESKERIIPIVAKRWDFVPDEIHVKRGETVILQFTAPDVPMGFHLPDFDTRTDILPGLTATLRLTPDKAGSFVFLCDVFCGSGHEDMGGKLIVT